MLREVTDAIKMVSDNIKNLKEIAAAVKEGCGYFSKKYPGIKEDVAAMCVELRKTCNAVATASAIMTHFRFNISPDAINHEPTRFNEYFIRYKDDTVELENLIRQLKGSCSKIGAHADRLRSEAAARGFDHFLAFFGLHSHERTAAIEQALQDIYNEEKEWYIVVGALSNSISRAIKDVSDTLGAGGMMHADNVNAAATLLNNYAALFGALELEARSEANEIQELVDALNV